MTGTAIKMAMPHFMDSVTSDEFMVSNKCKHALFQWIADLRSMKPHALRMADASAKMINGILTGTVASFGSYDQCVETVAPNKDVRGQYCTIEAWPPLPPKPRFYALNRRLDAFKRFENDTGMMGEFTKYLHLFYMFPFRIGVCVPSDCSREDIYNISVMVTKRVFPVNVTVPSCETKQELVIENYQIPMICVLTILVVLVSCGTITDIFLNYMGRQSKSEQPVRGYSTKCVLSFSVISNWKVLMDLESGSDTLSILHGIRFFSMCWIIFGHTYYHLDFKVLKYLQITIELTSQFAFNTITNASLLVDNFFFISGLLFIYIGWDIVEKTGNIPNPFYFAIHRIWRFLPIQMFFVGISTLLPLLGDGPMWHENIDPIVEGCKKDWWLNFVFINNLYRTSSKGCLSYSWYLAADIQVYIICIPLVILIMKKPVIGLWVNFVIMIASVVGVGIQNYIRDFPPTNLFIHADVEQRTQLMMETYYPPLHHLGPHCLGIFVGYYLRQKMSPKSFHWKWHILAWILTFAFTTSALFGVHPWNNDLPGTGKVATVLYASLSRMSWTIGLAWIVIACSTGCGGFLTYVLAWKPLIPLSRLTFMVYMVHPLIQHVFYSTLREGIQARNSLAIFIYFGFVVSSYAFGVAVCLLLEAPFVRMGKVVFEIEEAIRKKKLTLKELFLGKTRPRKDHSEDESKPGHLNSLPNGVPNNDMKSFYDNFSFSNGRIKNIEENIINNRNDFVCRL
ncbi:nose resistant to fluoxetine protein 6 [Caerostris darwini]|uniref:Nose resistant to fluoxetine protein 6 n=1 Tax=Caerostris darwini TaxID=1538125 RepID=A0AAV4X7T3_9ARAC|nr:nose resistant to fluoxetine protein 6 [Caerostris darwini]